MQKRRHAKFVKTFEEFRRWLCEHFTANWQDSTLEEILETHHGAPRSFPARVWLEEYQSLVKSYSVCHMSEIEFYGTSRQLVPPHGKVKELKPFKWKDRHGNFHRVEDMDTRHLFMTMIMIWNHTMPAECRIVRSGRWQHHMYNIGPFYTANYLKLAVLCMAEELFTRDDLEQAWLDTLEKLKAHYKVHYKILETRI